MPIRKTGCSFLVAFVSSRLPSNNLQANLWWVKATTIHQLHGDVTIVNLFDNFCPVCNQKYQKRDAEEINHIIYGAFDLQLDLSGHTLAELEEALVEKYDLKPGADAYMSGEVVKDKARRLRPGERVEFL